MIASASFRALGTTATIVVADAHVLEEARALLESELVLVDEACSRFRPDSALVRANARAGHTVEIGSLLGEHIATAIDAAETTDGLVTPTLGSVISGAGYDRTFELVRLRGTWTVRETPARIDAWRDIELDVARRTLCVPRGVELDLGATAKALVADRAAARAARAVRCGVLVSLGGDIAVAGEAPGTGWVVRIADDHEAPPVGGPAITVSTGGLATSSTAVRRWPTDRGPAHHVIDPRTASPSTSSWRTASVCAESCVEANVAALAALLLGAGARAWLEERGLHARLVHEDGAIMYAGAWPAEAEAA
ncbi:MAG: FAD:protein FMN transferase [Gaiellaceae bacterium]